MNGWQALQAFWESFGIPAYDENTVPDEAEMPYIAYEASVGGFNDPVYLTAQIFFYSPSWEKICLKAEEIKHYIGYGFRTVKIDGGYLKITRGSPFARKMEESNNDMVRRTTTTLLTPLACAPLSLFTQKTR